MNKSIIYPILSFLILSSWSAKAQDLIVTAEGDSLNCKITKVQNDYIYFTFQHNDEIRNTLLALNQVKTFQYKYFSSPEIPVNMVNRAANSPKLRLSLNTGWSYRINKLSDDIPSNLKEYSKGLKSGFHYGADITGFVSEQLGFGLRYIGFNSKNSINNIHVSGIGQVGTMSDNITIKFIGPMAVSQIVSHDKKNAFLIGIGIGYMGYRNNSVVDTPLTIRGSTVGFSWDVGYDIGLSDKLALGFQISYLSGKLSKLDVKSGSYSQTIELEEGNYEGLARLDFSIGLRFK